MKRIVPLVVLALLSGCATPRAEHETQGLQHHFDDPERWARTWDDPDRDEWQQPAEVLKTLALRPDEQVADLGAGTGYFTVRLAYAVPRGKVYAVDVEPSMVRYLQQRAQRMQLSNVSAVLAAEDDPKLPGPVDLVLIVNTYHHLQNREAYFRRLAAQLKEGGRVAIIDFTKEAPFGPPVRERLTPGDINSEMEVAGYKLVQAPKFLRFQHFLIFEPLAK